MAAVSPARRSFFSARKLRYRSPALFVLCGSIICFLFAVMPIRAAQGRAEFAQSIVAALRARNFQRALDLTHSALRKSPTDPQILSLEGLALAGLGRRRPALAAYERALSVAPEYLPALEGAAQIEYAAGAAGAAPLLERILKIRPLDPTAHAMLGVLAYRRHDCKTAIQHFEASGEVLWSQPPALEEYGFCLMQAGRVASAVKVYEGLVSLAPSDPRDRIYLGAAQLLADKPSDALATLDPLLRGSNQNPDALDIAANACEKIGDTPRAVQLLREAIVKDPNNVNYYLDFATLAFDHSSFRVGIDMLNVGLSHLPKSAPLYLARGILYIQLAQYAKGQADFETAERLDPGQAFSSESESLAQEQQSGAAEALATVRSQLKLHPNDPVLLYLLAHDLVQNGARPGNPAFRQALQADKRAVAIRPSLILARDLLSRLYYDEGNLAEAIQQCRIALRLEPSDQEALYRLALALGRTGKTAQVPALLKRLAQLREADRKEEADRNRYKFIETAPSTVPSHP